jgi:hypothetical protein
LRVACNRTSARKVVFSSSGSGQVRRLRVALLFHVSISVAAKQLVEKSVSYTEANRKASHPDQKHQCR